MDERSRDGPLRCGDADRPLYRGVQSRVNYSGVHSTGERLWPRVGDVVEFPSFCLRPLALLLLTISVTAEGGELTVMEIPHTGLHMSAVSIPADELICCP